jgi:hypothetical protein
MPKDLSRRTRQASPESALSTEADDIPELNHRTIKITKDSYVIIISRLNGM